MITFEHGKGRFNYRAAGILLDGDLVLMHRADWEDYWSLPGGRGEMLEPAAETLRREMREELGVDADVGRLVWAMENFFEVEGKPWHEIGLYFLMTLPRDSRVFHEREFLGQEDHVKLVFRWFPIDELDRARIFPSFLRKGLKAIPPATEHVVHVDATEVHADPEE